MESFLTSYGLSNSGEEKLQFTPFWDGPKPVYSDGLRAGAIESHNFFVLGLKRDEALIPPVRRVVEFRARYG